jgi:hypothetical protein
MRGLDPRIRPEKDKRRFKAIDCRVKPTAVRFNFQCQRMSAAAQGVRRLRRWWILQCICVLDACATRVRFPSALIPSSLAEN